MMSFPTKGGKLRNDVTHVILANHKTERCVHGWLREHAMFDAACFPAFVGASNVTSSVL